MISIEEKKRPHMPHWWVLSWIVGFATASGDGRCAEAALLELLSELAFNCPALVSA